MWAAIGVLVLSLTATGASEVFLSEKLVAHDYKHYNAFYCDSCQEYGGTYGYCNGLYDTECHYTGGNFIRAGDYVVLEDPDGPKRFTTLEWYYSWCGGRRGCAVKVYGSTKNGDWQPVADEVILDSEGTSPSCAVYRPGATLSSAYVEAGRPRYNWWKLEWTKNTAVHGPVVGWMKIVTPDAQATTAASLHPFWGDMIHYVDFEGEVLDRKGNSALEDKHGNCGTLGSFVVGAKGKGQAFHYANMATPCVWRLANAVDGVTEWSVSFWMKPDYIITAESGRIDWLYGGSFSSGTKLCYTCFHLTINRGGVTDMRMYHSNPPVNIQNPPFAAGRWYHVFFTQADTTRSFYLDGVLQDSQSGSPVERATGQDGLDIMFRGSSGALDDVIFYRRSFSQAEVQTAMAAEPSDEAPTPAPSPVPTPAPTGTTVTTVTLTTTTRCQNSPPSWEDMHGNDCGVYVANEECVIDGVTSADYIVPPSKACCICGGGTPVSEATAPPTPMPTHALQWAELGMSTSVRGVGADTYALISDEFNNRVRGAVATSVVSLNSTLEWDTDGSRRLDSKDNGFSVHISMSPPRGASKRMMFKQLTAEGMDHWRARFQSTIDALELPRGVEATVTKARVWLMRAGVAMIVMVSGSSFSLLPDLDGMQRSFEKVVLDRVTETLVTVELKVGGGRGTLASSRALGVGVEQSEFSGAKETTSVGALDMTINSRVLYDESLDKVEEFFSEKKDDIGSSIVVTLTEEPFDLPNSSVNISIVPEFSGIVFQIGEDLECQSGYDICGELECCPIDGWRYRCNGYNSSGMSLRDIYQTTSTPAALDPKFNTDGSMLLTVEMCGWTAEAAEGNISFMVDMAASKELLTLDGGCASKWALADVNRLEATFTLGELKGVGGNCSMAASESAITGYLALFLILDSGSESMVVTTWVWPVSIATSSSTVTASLGRLDVWSGMIAVGEEVQSELNLHSKLTLYQDSTFSKEKSLRMLKFGEPAFVAHVLSGDVPGKVRLSLMEVLLKDAQEVVMSNLTEVAKTSESLQPEMFGITFKIELPLCMGCYINVVSTASRFARSLGSGDPIDQQTAKNIFVTMVPPAHATFNAEIVGLSYHALRWNEALKEEAMAELRAAVIEEVAGEAHAANVKVVMVASLGWARVEASIAVESAGAAKVLAHRLRISSSLGDGLKAAIVSTPNTAAVLSDDVDIIISDVSSFSDLEGEEAAEGGPPRKDATTTTTEAEVVVVEEDTSEWFIGVIAGSGLVALSITVGGGVAYCRFRGTSSKQAMEADIAVTKQLTPPKDKRANLDGPYEEDHDGGDVKAV